jgi:hypothetical protein
MPGPVSDSFKGKAAHAPYVPSWCYPNDSPKMCPCGHHEGYHNDAGECLHAKGENNRPACGCTGLPADCRTPDTDF